METVTLEELQRDYGRRLAAAAGDAEASSWAWIWYLVEWHRLEHCPQVYRVLTKRPKDAGLANILAYVRGGITLRELYNRLRSETADVYAQALDGAGIAPADESRGYSELTAELALEAVKACRDLRGLTSRVPGACPPEVANAAATIWLRFLEEYHARVRLPKVAELRDERVLEVASPAEDELLEANDFREFVIADELERQELRDLVGLEAAAIEPARL